MKIKNVIITPMLRPMPEGMFDPMPEVVATFEDGSTKTLFSFYPNEVSFQPSEFAGLTAPEFLCGLRARLRFFICAKVQYLQTAHPGNQ